jgi:hypothetical protein
MVLHSTGEKGWWAWTESGQCVYLQLGDVEQIMESVWTFISSTVNLAVTSLTVFP